MPLQRFEIANDDRKEVVEVVGDPTGKLANTFHFVRLLKPLFGCASLSQIARHLGKADDLALRVPYGVDHDASPELSSVLSYAPTFRFVLPGAGRGFNSVVWHAGLPVVVGVEAGKMLPDDFRWLIALDSLSAGIPVHHDAGWIEHEDRVIGDPFNQHSKTPLALLQLDDACSELLGALRDAL